MYYSVRRVSSGIEAYEEKQCIRRRIQGSLYEEYIHNEAFNIDRSLQDLEEMFCLLCSEAGHYDKATIADQQIRIMRSEARHLKKAITDLSHFLFYQKGE